MLLKKLQLNKGKTNIVVKSQKWIIKLKNKGYKTIISKKDVNGIFFNAFTTQLNSLIASMGPSFFTA